MYELSWASCVCLCVHRFPVMLDLLHVVINAKKTLRFLLSFSFYLLCDPMNDICTFAGPQVRVWKKSPESFLMKFILQYLRMQWCFSKNNPKLSCGLKGHTYNISLQKTFFVKIWAFENLRFYSNHPVSLLVLLLVKVRLPYWEPNKLLKMCQYLPKYSEVKSYLQII